MTVLIYRRLPAFREEKKQGASSHSVAREEVSAASGIIGSNPGGGWVVPKLVS